MAETFQTDQLRYEAEYRAKYDADELKALAAKGHTFDGGDSYPIDDAEDLGNAIHAVGRGNANHDALRKYIMSRAKAMGLTDKIPENWNADGSLNQANAASKQCPTCDGTGTIKAGTTECPDCGGTGNMQDQNEDQEASLKPLFEYHKAKASSLRGIERRSFGTEQFELRANEDATVLKFDGYASLTSVSYPVGFYNETIQRGAFKRTLGDKPDVQLLINHGEGGSGMPIARTGANMTLVEDDRGLKVEADLDPADPDVMLLKRKMDNGLIDQMSFAFQVTDQDWSDDYTERTIKSVSIHRGDVSVVNQGASETTMASIRSLEDLRKVGVTGVLDCLLEVRAGAVISASNKEVLTKIFESCVSFDNEMDSIIPALAALTGKPDPNDADTHNPDGSPKAGLQASAKSAIQDSPTTSSATDGRALADKKRRQQRQLDELKRKAS